MSAKSDPTALKPVVGGLTQGATTLVYSGGAYPARPVGLPAGAAIYIGPTQPTDWLTGDLWSNNS